MPGKLSHHAIRRASQRGLSEDEIAFVFYFGRRLHRTGIQFVFLGARDIPRHFKRSHGHLAGATLLIAPDGTVLTVYKNQAAWRTIKKKTKRSRRELPAA
ncbi:MAG TPA: hypothetical protein V6D47_05950 [Oscillatoriaceae cyanobacterium]